MSDLLEPYHQTKEFVGATTLFVPKRRASADYVRKVPDLIYLPAFSIPNLWYGASHIIGKYNYTIFSKVGIIKLPTKPNDTFCLCITFDNLRFKLWEDVSEILYESLYSGAKTFGLSFSLEIWNVEDERTALNPGVLPIEITSFTLPNLDNITCATLVGTDRSSYAATCDNTLFLTGFNPSTQQYSFVNDPCAGEIIPL